MSVPLVLGKYSVRRFLGRGSMGQAFLAHAPSGAEVVIKFMHPQRAAHASFRKLFASELRIMAGFYHPDSVRFLEGGVDETGGPCIVMEYIHGIGFHELIRECGRMTAERLGNFVLPLCRAVHSAHEAGIVHRDLKPSNLLVTNPGKDNESLKVMDLGLAALATQLYLPLANLRGNECGDLVGTRAYMCPEQIRGDDTDCRGDLYSIGVLLFEALTGQLPFKSDDPVEILLAHLHDRPPSFASRGVDDVSPKVEDLVQRLLAKFPNERPNSGFDLAVEYCEAIGRKVAFKASEFTPQQVVLPDQSESIFETPFGAMESGWTCRLKKLIGR